MMACCAFFSAHYEQAGRYEDAIGEYEQMYKADPRSTIAANNLASLLAEYREDEASFDRASKSPVVFAVRRSRLFSMVGLGLLSQGDSRSVFPSLKQAAKSLSGNGVVQYHLGMAYLDSRANRTGNRKSRKGADADGEESPTQAAKTREALKGIARRQKTSNRRAAARRIKDG